jgi:S1-C subfamily serine protease
MSAAPLIFALLISSTNADDAPADRFPAPLREAAITATVGLSGAGGGRLGSGVLIGRSGPHVYILTAAHVVAGARQVDVHVRAKGKSEVCRSAVVLARSAEADLAILRLPASTGLPKPLRLAAVKEVPKAPCQALSVGWASGDAPTAQEEQVRRSALVRRPGEKTSVQSWQTERKQARGRSGGPLLDRAGRVIGVASGHDREAGYYVHVAEIYRFLKNNGLGWLTEETEK